MVNIEGNCWARPNLILVATDLNDLSRLMPFATAQAQETGARLMLIHVLPVARTISSDAAGLPYYDAVGALEYADKVLLPWCEGARRAKVACDALVREGNPAQEIAAAARQFQAARVLLGTRSRGKISKLLLGSVAEQVLRSVYLPVITVGPEAHLPVDESSDHVVLHATTLRETSRPSAALACQIAAAHNGKLLLLHVLPPLDRPAGIDPGELREMRLPRAEEELRQLAIEAGAGACGCADAIVVEGNPAIEILSQAIERRASLIVLGATNRWAFANLTRDRTIYQVLAHAPCPVLTLREPLDQPLSPQEQPAEAVHQ